ncbi:FtsX-like permease family protein [Corynebacterium atrinae]|uniref:ABC transporter permease n=1 Tax=Corynebacterium atrinae TaxID=1336740 RepID=UPI0025B43E98|nr:ABC transporter permease [Corynebacterium atrinae]WJY64220.1 FtsX-like permease family protein [Corynebacterium atrinae]
MFVAWKELRFARGRFALIGAVVALITLLVGFLSGLTGGLAAQNVSAVLHIPADRIVLQQPTTGSPSFSTSSLDPDTVRQWQDAPGVESVTPIGITQTRAARTGSEEPTGVALFGQPSDLAEGEVELSTGAAAALNAQVGDTVSINNQSFTVAAIDEDLWYSHTPVITMSQPAWSELSQRVGGTGEPTMLAVTGTPDWAGVDKQAGTVAQTPLASLAALDAFSSEVGSLGLMIAMLFGISALVVGAFFTVWTMQRAGDIAVLKALGASTSSLVRDALGQAFIVLAVGIGVGVLAVVGLGQLAGQALPFVLSPLTTLAPAAILALLGLLGAAFALRIVTSADPLTALGSNR